MSKRLPVDPVTRLFRLLAERLDRYVEGDETSLETLGESMELEGFSLDDVQAAAATLARFGGAARGEAAVADVPGEGALRILSPEERDALTTEAWGFLIDQRRRGALNAEQVEQILELIVESGVRPVDVEMARVMAAQVALDVGPSEGAEGMFHDDSERPH